MPNPRKKSATLAAAANHPYGKFNFLLEIEGVTTTAGFTEVSGIRSETEVIEYREGGDVRGSVRKLPGLHKFANVVLKRGFSANTELWQWRQLVVNGSVDRRAGSIILLDAARNEVLRWNFYEGWPCKWEGPALNAKSGEVAIETLEIAVESIELA
jgi:phage tail-like protein